MFSKRAEERRASLATIDNSYILKTRKVKQEEEELIWECIHHYFVKRKVIGPSRNIIIPKGIIQSLYIEIFCHLEYDRGVQKTI